MPAKIEYKFGLINGFEPKWREASQNMVRFSVSSIDVIDPQV